MERMDSLPVDVVTRFRDAFIAHDPDAAIALLAPDFVMYPAASSEPARGPEAGRAMFRAFMDTFDDFQYLGEMSGAVWDGGPTEARVGLFRGQVDGVPAQSISLLQLDDDDRIAVMTVMVRPLAALTEFSERVQAHLKATSDR
ncbi:nuclear transport factor 2 family protein [Nocardia terpenica]|uniref:SnoaL-like domain-containing protein n=1 Tax=Nocardia terpenica TaxID=455432 RepID=A0A164M0B6_9NOCA|nr:nuclear transport factor 2 family protein [Nocardia terpenica]KZM72909.1 hypothetical protein AWN90_29610 [Nocardia terpenica]MBF6061168.1 nuclear transport factor 2 family protein [Nocardia terpenica]MBF6105603.1 nuclear transport factor 2 family protein [Nocardia terpenica]MBF6112927.1 nuclear transport factor 2 family protein [Nocardia terpenica]MBF6119057.1 nuclear transport factor 2 family protein [Nocardia terpenica]